MTLAEVRRIALALADTVEAPHFRFTSFRVRGKIFATASPDGGILHVFVGEEDRARMLAVAPAVYAKLWWGKNVAGLKIALPKARRDDIRSLLRAAHAQKTGAAPRKTAR